MNDEIRNCFIIGGCILLCIIISLGGRFINNKYRSIDKYEEV